MRLEPMSAFERKCVHDVINALAGVESESEGVEPHRRIVVRPVFLTVTDADVSGPGGSPPGPSRAVARAAEALFGDRLALASSYADAAGDRRCRPRTDRSARGTAHLGPASAQLRRDGRTDPIRRFCRGRGVWSRFARYRARSGPT